MKTLSEPELLKRAKSGRFDAVSDTEPAQPGARLKPSLPPTSPKGLLAIRKSLGLTQDEMARATGCVRSSIDNWEHGRRPIPKYISVLYRYIIRHGLLRGGKK